MIGRAVTLDSVLNPKGRASRHSLYGEVIGSYQSDIARSDEINKNTTYRTILIILLHTFDKGHAYEVPIECVVFHSSLEEAKEYGRIE